MSRLGTSTLNTIYPMIRESKEGGTLEIHFSKPVVARVKKCRMVVVKKRLNQEDAESECAPR